jgi:hypothetical protein
MVGCSLVDLLLPPPVVDPFRFDPLEPSHVVQPP